MGVDLFYGVSYVFAVVSCVAAEEEVVVDCKILENTASFGDVAHAHCYDFVGGDFGEFVTFVNY